jgi:nicotinamide riboside transporter PnuC
MNWELFSWGLVAASLVGNIFVVKKHVIGQWLWAAANLGWICFNLTIQAYAQAFLFTVFFAMCVWGIIAWSRGKQDEAQAT